jgi:Flp pilus assembly pilin Flp
LQGSRWGTWGIPAERWFGIVESPSTSTKDIPREGPRDDTLEREVLPGGRLMSSIWKQLWKQEDGQDIAEYAVMLAVILVIVIGTIRLIGTNANTIFSKAASNIQ